MPFEKRELIIINTVLLYLCQVFGISHKCINCKKSKQFFIHCDKACLERCIRDTSKKIIEMFEIETVKFPSRCCL